MGIRASSGGQLGGGGNGGSSAGTLTVEQVQDILSESLLPSTTVDGLSLTSTYNDATGKISLTLGTPSSAPIAGVVAASIEVEKSGGLIGAATAFNFAGPGVGAISITDNVATINILGGNGGNGGGADGISISGANINSSGNLVITLTDGTVLDTGHVVGSNGVAGTAGLNGVSVTGAAVNVNGQLVVQLSNGQQINAGAVVGPQGPFGPQGAAGAKGDTGAQGVKGDTGAQGVKGDTGTTGATGATGLQGVKGDTGLQGVQGVAGRNVASTAIDGNGNLQITLRDGVILTAGHVVGAQGAQGIQGLQGIAGVQGVKGDTGASVSSAVVNASGHLIRTKSDGVILDA